MKKKIKTVLSAVLAVSLTLSACSAKMNESVFDNTETLSEEKISASEDPPLGEHQIVFGTESGFYNSEISLEIICTDENAKIYYTTDGSIPDENDDLYTEPIILVNRTSEPNKLSAKKNTSAGGDFIPREKVDKANVIRAAAFFPDGTKSEIISGTYFIGTDKAKKYGNVPVISLMTDTENLFDYEKGIYVLGKTYDDWLKEDPNNKYLEAWQAEGNYSNKGREWERPVTVNYFNSDGTFGFSQDMGIRIMGAASRNSTQKSFRLTARSDYGEKAVNYEIIPENTRSDEKGNVTKYKSFVLRNGGNDCDYAKVRDPFLQKLVSDRRFETEQTVPCVVYLDGEYWGMYTLTEDYSDNYIENNLGIDNKNVVVLKRGKIEDGEESDISLYEQMYDFITGNDMTNVLNYEKASEMLDTEGFADYCALNLYICNEDSIFKNNNWEMWRVRNTDAGSPLSDGKWRMMVYDIDYSSGIYDGGQSSVKDNIKEIFEPDEDSEDENERHPKNIFLSLYENEEFRSEFITALCDMRNINFESRRAVGELISFTEDYKRLVPDTFRRFGPGWVADQRNLDGYYSQKINELSKFLDERYQAFPYIMKDALKLGSEINMTLSVSDGEKGEIFVNSSKISIKSEFEGIYFDSCRLSLRAVPTDGYKFVRWEYSGCNVSDENSEEIKVTFSDSFTIKAVFE